jgi:hypothetical protein
VLRSLKSRIIATMALLVALVLVIAILGVTAINALDRSASRELALVVAGSDLSTSLVGTTAAEMRASDQTALSTAWCLVHLPVFSYFFQASSKLASAPCVFMAMSPMLALCAVSIARFSSLFP